MRFMQILLMRDKQNSTFKCFKYFLRTRFIFVRWKLFGKPVTDFKRIPIIINNYNRLTTLKQLIEALEKRGYSNIHIIDNASTYEPLLRYYETCPYNIFRLKKNVGYKAIWKTGIYKQFHRSFYAYTDSDVVPHENCPDDFLEHFWKIMMRYKFATKVGFALKIDDLPDTFEHKQYILECQHDFWQYEVEKDLFRAPIDTTFALYRPFAKTNVNWYVQQFRTAGSYIALHLPWYNDTKNLSEEERYYIRSCTESSTLGQREKTTEN